MEEEKIIEVDKPSMKVLLNTIGEDYKCNFCEVDIDETNFGLIHVNVQTCNNIICQIEGLDKLEELKNKK